MMSDEETQILPRIRAEAMSQDRTELFTILALADTVARAHERLANQVADLQERVHHWAQGQ